MTGLVAVARDENRYINEWVRHHIDVGFDSITIYDNHSYIPLGIEIDKLPKKYRDKVSVDIEPISFNPQKNAYQRGLEKYKSADWLAFFDIDEFLQITKPLPEILDRGSRVGALFISWKCFNANGQAKYEDKPVQERFLQECEILDKCTGKSIVRPSAVLSAEVHYPILIPGNVMLMSNNVRVFHASNRVLYDDIWLNHYYTKSYEEWLWKINRGSCDSRCLKKYSEFFLYNPDLAHLKEEHLKNMVMGCGHQEASGMGEVEVKQETPKKTLVCHEWVDEKDVPEEYTIKLFPNRELSYELAKRLLPEKPVIAELGVDVGNNASVLLDVFKPSKCYLIDNFWYNGKLEERIENYLGRINGVELLVGDSSEQLGTLSDDSLDFIYIDADHTYEGVKRDIDVAHKKIKKGGIIQFNDYCRYDYKLGMYYGVVDAVNEFLQETKNKIICMSIPYSGFHDVTVQILNK